MKTPLLSTYGSASKRPSPAGRMMAAFAREFREGTDINLGVGYVNETTIPRDLIRDAFEAVLNTPDKYRVPLNYGGPSGSGNLINAITNFILRTDGGGLTPKHLERSRIIVGANGATSLLDGLAQILEPGIVITCDPTYYIYTDFLERKGFEILAIPEAADGMDLDHLQATLEGMGKDRERIRFIYVVTVNNPTSTITTNPKRRDLIRIATDLSRQLDREVPVILDRAYDHLIHDPAVEKPHCGLLYDELGLVYEVATFSKVLAPALRIGYMLGPDSAFMNAMVQRTSDVGFSAPLINQEIASYILENHIQDQIDQVNQGYRDKAPKIQEWIERYLGSYLEDCRGGQAGFYFYLTFRDIRTDEASDFFKFLHRSTGILEVDGPGEAQLPRVAYIPGQHCVHPGGELVEVGKRQLRLSYGFEELDRIESAVKIMGQAAAYALSK
jgi:DNA-binding transcriptional MocR family regulator